MATFTEQDVRADKEISDLHRLAEREFWRLDREHGSDPAVVARRTFRYRCGAKAILYVRHAIDMNRPSRHDTPLDPRRRWEAGLLLPFSEGPQGGTDDRRIGPVLSWALRSEEILRLGFDAQDIHSPAGRELLAVRIGRLEGWWMLCMVFDVDFYAPTSQREKDLFERASGVPA